MRMYVIDYARKWKLGTTCLMNFLGMFGIVVAAWAFMVLVGSKVPQHARETVLMRGDDVLAVHWAGHCQGGERAAVRHVYANIGVLRDR